MPVQGLKLVTAVIVALAIAFPTDPEMGGIPDT